MKYLKKFQNHSGYEDFVESEEFIKPNVSLCKTERECHYTMVPYAERYLTFKILSGGTIVWVANDTGATRTISYSKDRGKTWTDITSSTAGTSFNVSAGDKVILKGKNTNYSTNGIDCSTFSASTATFDIEGNIMSLISGDSFSAATTLTSPNTFCNLFKNTKVVNARHLILPAKTLAAYCYYYMFYCCAILTTAPELPAMTLHQDCYAHMFKGCTSLTTAPQLPATTLSAYCYEDMFQGCTSLTIAPELPATRLAIACYYYMFKDCTSLTTAPQLPATTLAISCYWSMFRGCTSLTIAPQLPATTLTQSCYDGMFSGCTNLTTAPELPATTLATECYNNMFVGTNVLPDCSNIDFTSPVTVASGGLRGLFGGTKVTDSDLMEILPINSNDKYYLPVTSLTSSCYASMFRGCTSLTTAPELPATTLASGCYYNMFYGCTSLTTAPELPAISLSDACYDSMFYGCAQLAYIKALFLTDLSESSPSTSNWVYGVSDTGTFVKNRAATWDEVGPNGVPNGWTITYEGSSGANRYIAIDNFIPEYEEECGGNTACILEEYANSYDFDSVNENGCGIYLYNGEYVYNGEPCYIWEMIDNGINWSNQVAFILTTSNDYYGETLEDGVLTQPVICSLNEDLEDNYEGEGSLIGYYIFKQWDE